MELLYVLENAAIWFSTENNLFCFLSNRDNNLFLVLQLLCYGTYIIFGNLYNISLTVTCNRDKNTDWASWLKGAGTVEKASHQGSETWVCSLQLELSDPWGKMEEEKGGIRGSYPHAIHEMEGRRTTCPDIWELVFHAQWAGFVWFQFSSLALFCLYFFLTTSALRGLFPKTNDTQMDITTTLYNLYVYYWNLCPFLHTLVYFVNRNIK